MEHDAGSFTVYNYVEGEMVATEIPAGDLVMTGDFWANTVDWCFATPFFTEVGDPNTLHLIDQGDTEYLIPMPEGVSEEDIVEVYGGDRILLMTEDTAYVREDAFDTSEWSEATEITKHLNAGRIKGITIGTTEIYVLLDDGVLYKVN